MTPNPTPGPILVEQQEAARYTGYSAYKPSEVSWLGQIPESWDTTRLKWLFRVVNGATPKTSQPEFWGGDVAWATPEDLGDSEEAYLNATQRTLTRKGLESCGAGLVPSDSIILSTRAPIGYVKLAGQPTATNQGCRSLIPQKAVADPRFYHYALQSARQMLQAFGTGATFQELSSTELGLVSLPVPPPEEQKAVASFLRAETQKLNNLIAKKQRLIELLEEKRTALITRAVTKGLDPDVPMKDSGLEWLGEVPEHWDVAPTKYVARLESGHTPNRNKKEYWRECEFPWFTLADVGSLRSDEVETVTETTEEISQLGLNNSAARLLPEGTVMLSRTASVGFSAIMGRPMATSQDFVNWVCGDQLVSRYLLYVFRSMRPEFRRLVMGSTHMTIYMPDVEGFRAPLPPVSEQRAIVEYVQNTSRRETALKERIRSAITLLQEYRSALITAAVTGKIDVRDHAA